MNTLLICQITYILLVIISFSVFLKKSLKIYLNQCFLISIAIISIILLFTYNINQFNLVFVTCFFVVVSTIPFLFRSFRLELVIERRSIIEFIFIVLIILFFSYNRILMDEDELYFWGVQYKFYSGVFIGSEFKNPFEYSGYGKIIPLWQTFITSFIGFKEGGAIFANNLILISCYYFLFGKQIKDFYLRIIYLIIIYLLLNNLSFGIFSIYVDSIICLSFACLIYYSIESFDQKKLNNFIIILLLLFFFLNIHRLTLYLSLFLVILFSFKKINLSKDKLKIFFSFLIFLFLILFFISINKYDYGNLNILNILFNDLLNSEYGFFNSSLILFKKFLKAVFLSKNYNSQFGISFNEILNYLNFEEFKLPEYIFNNSIWYLFCVFLIFLNRKKINNINYFFIIIFVIFACMIFINKIILEKINFDIFGRYISFILIPMIVINLIYLGSINIKKNKVILILIFFFLFISTPKKTFSIFFTKDYYAEYDMWNKNYYLTRERYKNLSSKINDLNFKRTFNILTIFKIGDFVYKSHPSLYMSALKLDMYPHHVETIQYSNFKDKKFNYNHYLNNKDIIIFYNLSDKEIIKLNTLFNKYIDIKKKLIFRTK